MSFGKPDNGANRDLHRGEQSIGPPVCWQARVAEQQVQFSCPADIVRLDKTHADSSPDDCGDNLANFRDRRIELVSRHDPDNPLTTQRRLPAFR